MPTHGRVFVDKVNLVSRHTKPTQAAPQGGIIKKEAAIATVSNVMICLRQMWQSVVRIRKQIDSNGNKSRVCAVCGANFDK